MKLLRTQHGVALLVALVVVALATLLIAGLLDRSELSVARTRNVLRYEQAVAYMDGLEAYAARVLYRDRAESFNVDSNDEIWAIPLPAVPVVGGTLSATMRDQNGCFNLNNLMRNGAVDPLWRDHFQRLLMVLKLDPMLANIVVDWLDADVEISTNGSEDANYLAQPVPYRAANRAFSHISELRLLKGVDGEIYARLAPHVCALPPGSLININTASVPVLMTLNYTMTEQLAMRLWNEGHAYYQATSDIVTLLQKENVQIDMPQHYSVQSAYFLLRGAVVLDEIHFSFYSLIERGRNGVQVLMRSRSSE